MASGICSAFVLALLLGLAIVTAPVAMAPIVVPAGAIGDVKKVVAAIISYVCTTNTIVAIMATANC
jgi:hypothetical protein